MSSANLSYHERREQALLDMALPAETDEQYAARCYATYVAELETLAEVADAFDADAMARLRDRALHRNVRRDYGRPAYGRKPSPGYGLPW